MSILQHRPQQLPYLVGDPRHWALDFGLIGLASGALGPLIMSLAAGVAAPVLVAGGLAGGLAGALLGAVAPGVLERVRGRIPLPVLWLLALPVGAVWGAAAGYAAGLASLVFASSAASPTLWALVAALAGALQLGAVWFPYTFLSVLDRPTWPLVTLACLGSVGLGPVVLSVLLGLLWIL